VEGGHRIDPGRAAAANSPREGSDARGMKLAPTRASRSSPGAGPHGGLQRRLYGNFITQLFGPLRDRRPTRAAQVGGEQREAASFQPSAVGSFKREGIRFVS